MMIWMRPKARMNEMMSGSLFTNSNWFAFEDDRVSNERSTGSLASPSPNTEETGAVNDGVDDEVIVGEDDDLDDTATSTAVSETKLGETDVHNLPGTSEETGPSATEKPPVWVEWRETPDSTDPSGADQPGGVHNIEPELKSEDQVGGGEGDGDAIEPCPSSSSETLANADIPTVEGQSESIDEKPSSTPTEVLQSGDENPSRDPTTDEAVDSEVKVTPDLTKDDKDDVKETGN